MLTERGYRGLKSTDKGANTRAYSALAKEGCPNGWTELEQLVNFERLTRIEGLTAVPIKGASALDVGCGDGQFLPFWRSLGGRDYAGVDINKSSIRAARERFPFADFRLGDFLTLPTREFDFCFASGTFNLRLPSGENLQVLQEMLRKMLGIARVGIAFNFLTPDLATDDPWLFQYDPKEIASVIRELRPDLRFVIDSDYFSKRNLVEASAFVWSKKQKP